MLTAALVERIVAETPGLTLEITAVEVDPVVALSLAETARSCEEWAQARGTSVRIEVQCADLIVSSAGFGATTQRDYDLVIMNPPYAKLGAASAERQALGSLGWDCPNRYAAFLALGVEALCNGGQLVAITPRSFANGPYFNTFRRQFLNSVAVNRLHTFESRSAVFEDTGVLQENIVFSVTKAGDREKVRITVSRDHRDVSSEYVVDYADLVRPGDLNGFIRITTNALEAAASEWMGKFSSSLSMLGVQVSTGRVVDFRVRQNLCGDPTPCDLPLVYPGNLRNGLVDWPRSIRKSQGFRILADSDRKALMPSGCYVLVKRFSVKEERRRIVAALWDPSRNGSQEIAFENHLNVFHRSGAGLDRELAWGLCLWLNGSLVDRFFRTFSGHTQVNATDLRSLRFPKEDVLRQLARQLDVLPEQAELDSLIDRLIQETVAV
jgi:adenine-specific DNA-methyltransferase